MTVKKNMVEQVPSVSKALADRGDSFASEAIG